MNQILPKAGQPLLALAALALALQSCALDPPGRPGAADLRASRALWERQELRDYRYTIGRTCECLPEMVGPAVVEVRGGRTVSVTAARSGAAILPEAFERLDTVDELFAAVQEAMARDPDELRVRYDPRRGHPVSFFVDYDRDVGDDEHGFTVESFEPLR